MFEVGKLYIHGIDSKPRFVYKITDLDIDIFHEDYTKKYYKIYYLRGLGKHWFIANLKDFKEFKEI